MGNATRPEAAAEDGVTGRYAFTLDVTFDLTFDFDSGSGHRGFARVGSGRLHGPRLAGTVAPLGGDWPVIRPDEVIEIDSRYMIELDDGALVYIRNRGLLRASYATLAALGRGEAAPGEFYYRCAPQIDAPPGPHAWLTRSFFVGKGAVSGRHLTIRFHEIL